MSGTTITYSEWARRPEREAAAALSLANLIDDKLGVGVRSDRLAEFIRENWTHISRLAHIIHGGSC
jgi:hypothetical protein